MSLVLVLCMQWLGWGWGQATALAKVPDARFPIRLQICLTQGWCVSVYVCVCVCAWPDHFVVHMPSCLHLLFCVACPLPRNRGG